MSQTHDPSNRRYPRYSCNFTGYLQVTMPEITFAPKQLYVLTKDLSVGGCRLMAKGIPPDLYRVMVREVRQGKLEIDLQDGRILNLGGRIVWMEFAGEETGLAISFNQLSPESTGVLSKLLESLKDSGVITEVAYTRPTVDLKPIDE